MSNEGNNMGSNSDQSQLEGKPFFEQLEEELFNSADSNNKIKIKEVKSAHYFLPPLQDFLELLNLPHTQREFLDLAESAFGINSKIGRSSKFAIFKEGVSKPTIKKLVNWYKRLPIPFEDILTADNIAKIDRSSNVGSNAGAWLSTIPFYKVSANENGSEKELKPLFNFIDTRCETEVSFAESLRKKVEAGELDRKDTTAIYNVVNTFWTNKTKIPKHAIGILADIATYPDKLKKPTKEFTLSIIEGYCYMRFDFYLEAITYFEIGCRYEYGNDAQNFKNKLGVLTRSIHAFSTNNSISTCFEAMLIEYKKILSDLVGETSFRKLASFIEINELENDEVGELLGDKQYKQLKRWRSGKDTPSNEKLADFLDKLDEYANVDSGYLLISAFRVAIGIDKLVRNVLSATAFDNCEPHEVEAIIKKVLAEIPTYYKSNITDFLNAKNAD